MRFQKDTYTTLEINSSILTPDVFVFSMVRVTINVMLPSMGGKT